MELVYRSNHQILQKSIKEIASSISRLTGVIDYKGYNLNIIDGVIPWNYYLSCKLGETKSHAIYWDKISKLLLQHITKHVSVLYCLGKTDFEYTGKVRIPGNYHSGISSSG